MGGKDQHIQGIDTRLREVVGPFAAETPVRLMSELFLPDTVLESPNLIVERERTGDRGRFAVLENRIVGTSWLLSPPRRSLSRRVTLYGFKGGVGRSTATAMLARHLAVSGRCVLVVDLDLESPGIGALTQRDEDLPEYGIVDHLVEDVVDNAGGLNLVTRSRLITGKRNGEVWLAPAAGKPRPGYDYLARLPGLVRAVAALTASTGTRRQAETGRVDGPGRQPGNLPVAFS